MEVKYSVQYKIWFESVQFSCLERETWKILLQSRRPVSAVGGFYWSQSFSRGKLSKQRWNDITNLWDFTVYNRFKLSPRSSLFRPQINPFLLWMPHKIEKTQCNKSFIMTFFNSSCGFIQMLQWSRPWSTVSNCPFKPATLCLVIMVCVVVSLPVSLVANSTVNAPTSG